MIVEELKIFCVNPKVSRIKVLSDVVNQGSQRDRIVTQHCLLLG
jgi:hypothetical protein